MEKRVRAIGGIFIKYKDPQAIRNWYRQHLGLNTDQYGTSFEWRHSDDPTKFGYNLWSTFGDSANYFSPSEKDFMLNLRVDDLIGLLEVLKSEGIEQIGETMIYDYGKFAHIMDPEGTKIELWEANDEEYGKMLSDGEGVTR